MKAVFVHGHRDPGCTRISDECSRRVAAALAIRANAIVFSGAGMPGATSEAAQMAAQAIGTGSDGVRLLLEQRAESTAENARYGLRQALILSATHVVIVTSWWHVPRSWLEWRRYARRIPDAPRIHVHAAAGSARYVPGELRALWRTVRPLPSWLPSRWEGSD